MICAQTGLERDIEAEASAYNKKWREVALAGTNARQIEIARTCARFELESDEFYTREDKAKRILGAA